MPLCRRSLEIRHGVTQHTIDGLALFALQPLLQHRKPAAHNVDGRLSGARGDNADDTDFHSRLTLGKQDFLHPLAWARTGKNDVDVAARFKTGEPDHALGEVYDLHRLAHVEHIDRHIRALRPQLARAILYATVTNCVAFLPLLLVKGRVGDFIYSLPVVVTASLISSRIVSMTFMPLLGYYVLRGQKGFESAAGAKGWQARVAGGYRRFAAWSLHHKALVLAACVAALIGGVGSLRWIGTAFFPKDLHDVFSVNVFLAEGTPIRQTQEETFRIVEQIERLSGDKVRSYTMFVGQGGPRFWLSIVPEQRADNYAQILVHTVGSRVTEEVVQRLKRDLPLCTAAARLTVEQLETGPPIGVPIQIRLFGDEIKPLRRIAAETKQQIRASREPTTSTTTGTARSSKSA